ncbi:MAG TPA: PP0621 family protein [Gallionella sp.]|nr:PP0621 family protein [Gallionella sp.]
MSRLLFLIAIVAVIYLLFRSYRKPEIRRDEAAAPEDMVRCAHCGVHLPKSESVRDGEQFFCCAAHRDAGRS